MNNPHPLNHNGGPVDCQIESRSGYIRVYRDIRNHELIGFGNPVKPADDTKGAYSKSEAFLDLTMECNYADGWVMNGGHRMRVGRGQLIGAVSWLAHRWNWTPKTVSGYLTKLQDAGMIAREVPDPEPKTANMGSPDGISEVSKPGKHKGKLSSLLTICNYMIYQGGSSTEGQTKGQTEGKQGANEGQMKGNNRKELKNLRTEEEVSREIYLRAHAPVAPITPSVARRMPPHELRKGEEDLGRGVFRNCDTIRHPRFNISISSIVYNLGTSSVGITKPDAIELAKAAATSNALQWALEIEGGKHHTELPKNIPDYIARGIINARHNAESAKHRTTAQSRWTSSGGRATQSPPRPVSRDGRYAPTGADLADAYAALTSDVGSPNVPHGAGLATEFKRIE